MTPAAPATRSEKGNRKSRLGERDRKKGEGGRHEDPILSDVQSSGEGGAEKAKKGGRKRVKQAEKFIDHGHLTQFDYLYTVEREREDIAMLSCPVSTLGTGRPRSGGSCTDRVDTLLFPRFMVHFFNVWTVDKFKK